MRQFKTIEFCPATAQPRNRAISGNASVPQSPATVPQIPSIIARMFQPLPDVARQFYRLLQPLTGAKE